MCTNFQAKQTTLTFVGADSKSALPRCHVCQFSVKVNNFDFFGPSFPKLGFVIQKTNVEIRISILKIPCVPSFRQNGQPWIFVPKFALIGFWSRNFENLSLDSESSLRYFVPQFSDKTVNFEFLDPNLPKNGFWSRYFKNLSLDSEWTPPIYHVCQFSVKMNTF